MPYVPFHEKCPEIAKKETRSISVIRNNMIIPEDDYGIAESYCDEDDCDCRRVFLNVISRKQNKVLAVIAFGWETEKFYENWFGSKDLSIIKEMQGPVLNTASHQSKLAPNLLELIKENVLNDKSYVKRLIRHYQIFRKTVADEKITNVIAFPNTGRNEPCPCGSGKKYKKCCLLKGSV